MANLTYVCFVPAKDCHHRFDASATSNMVFDEFAERSLLSPLAALGRNETYVCKAIVKFIYSGVMLA